MDETVFVTGGGRGIGRAIVQRFDEDGWNIVIHYNQSSEKARSLAERVDGDVIQADLSSTDGIEEIAKQIKSFSPEVFVNNAGIVGALDPSSIDVESWERTFRVNSTAPAVLCKEAAESMDEGGRIVNVGSIRGLDYSSRPGISAYCASKASLRNITSSFAQHYAPEIRINAVAPGFTDTDMTADMDPESRREVEGKTPMDRFGEPEEIAEAVRFLVNKRCRFLTGETLVVDGGYSVSG